MLLAAKILFYFIVLLTGCGSFWGQALIVYVFLLAVKITDPRFRLHRGQSAKVHQL